MCKPWGTTTGNNHCKCQYTTSVGKLFILFTMNFWNVSLFSSPSHLVFSLFLSSSQLLLISPTLILSLSHLLISVLLSSRSLSLSLFFMLNSSLPLHYFLFDWMRYNNYSSPANKYPGTLQIQLWEMAWEQKCGVGTRRYGFGGNCSCLLLSLQLIPR